MIDFLFRLLPHGIRARITSRHYLQKVVKNTGWLLLEKAVKLVLGFFIGVMMARYLGPDQYGILRYAITLFSLLGLFTQLGLPGLIVRDMIKTPEKTASIMGTSFVLRLIGSVLAYAAIVIIALGTGSRNHVEISVILIVCVGLVFKPLETINNWYESRVQSKYVALRDSFAFIITYVIKLILVLIKAPLIQFAYFTLLEFVLSAVFITVVYLKKEGSTFRWKASLAQAKELLSQSWLLLLSGILAQVYLKIDQVMLRLLVGTGEVGIYSVAVTISETWYFVPMAIVASVYPKLVELRKSDPARYSKNLQKIFDVLFLLALSLAVPITFFSKSIVLRLYGSAYQEAGGILMVHIWAGIFIFMRQLFSRWLIAEGLLTYSFFSHLLGAVSNVAINMLLIKPMGGMGAAVATLISYATASYFALFFTKKTRGIAMMMTLSLLLPFRLIKKGKNIWNI
jgi:O-antigen/teichoic acid export membrane protein